MIKPWRGRFPISPYRPSVVDIETATDGGVLDIGFGYGDCYEVFSDWHTWYERLRVLCRLKTPHLHRLYAHNGASFDWLSLVQELFDVIDDADVIASGSYTIGMVVKFHGIRQHIILCDSFRLLPAPLSALSAGFGLGDGGKLDLAGVLPEALKAANPTRYYDYLKHDVQAVQTILTRFWRLIVTEAGDIGELPMTLAALAMRLWRKTLEEPILTTWNPKVKALERAAYSGGRTDCFSPGVHQAMVYDINSSYPSAMASGVFPLSYRGYWVTEFTGQAGVYECDFLQSNLAVPPILRDAERGEPAYGGHGTFTAPELSFAIDRGVIISGVHGWEYDRTGNPFVKFVTKWWDVRRSAQARGDLALSFVAKILLNSLYGKFGQNETRKKITKYSTEKVNNLLDAGTGFICEGGFLLYDEESPSTTTWYGMAAYITAYARMNLYRAMETALAAGHQLIATDTDAIHITAGNPLPVSSALGGLKLEAAGECAYMGKKLYWPETGTPRAKGLTGLLSQMTYEEFCTIVFAGSRRVVIESMPTMRDVLLLNMPACQMRRQSRTLRRTATVAGTPWAA